MHRIAPHDHSPVRKISTLYSKSLVYEHKRIAHEQQSQAEQVHGCHTVRLL